MPFKRASSVFYMVPLEIPLVKMSVNWATVNRSKGNRVDISKSDLIQKSSYCRVSGIGIYSMKGATWIFLNYLLMAMSAAVRTREVVQSNEEGNK
ncbi:hypothetical protein Syun_023573 [Stephania yunnanensis]|uniref:Uncharacterized protein n=1 Tax=Stephania yunnanensis TaxID=152371 RepID=A0AAP0I2C2_9MAGN